LYRMVPNFSGNPAAAQSLFEIGPGSGGRGAGISAAMLSSGVVRFLMSDNEGASILNEDSSTLPSSVAGTPFDIWLTWDGLNATTSAQIWHAANGGVATVIGSFKPSQSMLTRSKISAASLVVGTHSQLSGTNNYYLNEMVIWDAHTLPSAYGARTDFISTTAQAFEGYNYTNPGVANVLSTANYIFAGVTLTGQAVAASVPSVSDVRSGTTFTNNLGVTLTGTLNVPEQFSGAASVINFAQIKENIRYRLNEANTTTADYDLSTGLNDRVKKILQIHPSYIPVQATFYPFVTMVITSKSIESQSMAINQKNAKRKATLGLKLIGGIFNSKMSDIAKDEANVDCEKLMENIEEIIRRDPTLVESVLWHSSQDIQFYDGIQEQAHLRIGVLSVNVTLLY
jgi:hypothetical protein